MLVNPLALLFSFLFMFSSPLYDGMMKFKIYAYPYQHMDTHVVEFEKAKEGLCKRDRDCAMIAKTIVWEARGEPEIAKRAIGFVVLNRVKHERWPDSVLGVVKQPHQFSFWKDKHKQKKPSEDDWTKGYEIAYDVVNEIVDNPIGESNHYHSAKVKPKWSKKMEFVVQLHNHKFYKN